MNIMVSSEVVIDRLGPVPRMLFINSERGIGGSNMILDLTCLFHFLSMYGWIGAESYDV